MKDGTNRTMLEAVEVRSLAKQTPAGRGNRPGQRLDCFALLRSRGALQEAGFIAARRLQDDLAVRFGLTGASSWRPDAVDHVGRRGEVTDRQLAKAEELEALASRVGQPSWALLVGLIEPNATTGSAPPWRAVVQRITGETAEAAQAAVVRLACSSLAHGYAQASPRDGR